MIKIQELLNENGKLKSSRDRKSLISIDEQLDELTNSPFKEPKPQKNYDNHIKILEKVEKLDEKIISVSEKIDEYKVEVLDKFENELNQINSSVFELISSTQYSKSQISTSAAITLGDKTIEKLQKMKETNMVIQIVRKLETEGMSWLLVERKDPLDKPLELKSSNSLSKSSFENHPGGRKLFWICEDHLKQDLLDYVYAYTPKFLLNSESLKLSIPDLFSEDSDREAWKMLKETTSELIEKRQELLKEQREIKLGLRRDNFLLEDAMTTETEERIRELENKNIEFEDELQSMREENAMIILKNKELLEYINLLNIRLREMNCLVYDFSRDKPQEEVMKVNADLIREIDKIKSEKMMAEAELYKIKDAIEKRKIRTSRPETKKNIDYPNSPASFDFDGEDNEIFGESFVIDSNNKELEEKLSNIQEELIAAKEAIEQKEKHIADLQEHIDDLEGAKKSESIDLKKSESFEMMHTDSIKHIKATLLQFLKSVPPTDKNNEALLNVIFDMLYMRPEEIREMKETRSKLKKVETPKKKATGIFGRMLQ